MINPLSQAAYLLLLLIFVPIPFTTDRSNSSRPWVTYALIAINTIVFFGLVFPTDGTQRQSDLFAVYGVVPRSPGLVPLVTSLFLHVSPGHLVWNMAFLWLFGPDCEDTLGHGAYAALYVVGGIVAGLLHTAIALLFAENAAVAYAPLVGASGAISAVVGVFTLRYYRSKLRMVWVCASFLKLRTATFQVPAMAGLTVWFVQNLFGAISALFQPDRNGIAYWAHIGGFIFGMAVAEITGLLGEGTREYTFADAMSATASGEDGMNIAVAKFRALLRKHPDDHVVLGQLAAIVDRSAANSAVNESVAEAYVGLLEHALTVGDDRSFDLWLGQFFQSGADLSVSKSSLFELVELAQCSRKSDCAIRLCDVLNQRFPQTFETLAADLEMTITILESRSEVETVGPLLSRLRTKIGEAAAKASTS